MKSTSKISWKKAHQQIAALSLVGLLLISLFSILLIPNQGDGVTGFAERNHKRMLT